MKHATFVEQVWFDAAITCRPCAEIGGPGDPDESFVLAEDDTIRSVRDTSARVCAESRARASSLGVDDLVTGNRRGPLPLCWVYLHMLREPAQYCCHADILREQILVDRRVRQE